MRFMVVVKVISIIVKKNKKPHKSAQKKVQTRNESPVSYLSAEPHTLIPYKLCSKTAEAAGSDPEIPRGDVCRTEPNKIYRMPHQCRQVARMPQPIEIEESARCV